MFTRHSYRLVIAICLVLFCFSVSQSMAGAQESVNISGASLQITEVTVSPSPTVGQTVDLSIKVLSTRDESAVNLTVNFLEDFDNKVDLVSGDTTWQGSLIANQPRVFHFLVMVTSEGTWPIEISARRISGDDKYFDFEIIHLTSSLTSGELIREVDYTFSQPFVENEMTVDSLTVNDSPMILAAAAPGPGEVQVVGNLSYDARESEAGVVTDILAQPLGRALVKLYDRNSGTDTLVGETNADSTGYYEFQPIANRTGIDLYIEVYATDGTSSTAGKVEVVDASGNGHYVEQSACD